jgi:D-alanine--D-alanine ligase
LNKPALVFGGKSPEHEVSLSSASNALKHIQKAEDSEVLLILIRKDGQFVLTDRIAEDGPSVPLCAVPGQGLAFRDTGIIIGISIAYLFAHGTNCEDGTLQSVFQSCGIPYTGCGVLSSALCMSKTAASELASSIAPSVPRLCTAAMPSKASLAGIGLPIIAKPECSGSSVGISIIETASEAEIVRSFTLARQFSPLVLFEKLVKPCREFECGILEHQGQIIALRVCELVRSRDFLSYDDKYRSGSDYILCPAPIDDSLQHHIQQTSIRIFQKLSCRGFARIDYLMDSITGTLYFNEANTIPGFTATSHYPRMLEASGIGKEEFIKDLRKAAFDLHSEQNQL